MSDQRNPLPATIDLLNGVADEVIRFRAINTMPRQDQSTLNSTVLAGDRNDELVVDAEKLVRITQTPASQVGRMPPQPPTLRAKVGSLLVQFVRRCLFWYSVQVNEANHKIAETLRRLAHRTLQLANLVEQTRRQQQAVEAELRTELSAATTAIRGVLQDRDALQQESTQALNMLRRDLDELSRTVTSLGDRTRSIQHDVHNVEDSIATLQDSIRKGDRTAQQTRALFHGQEARISLLMRERRQEGIVDSQPASPHAASSAFTAEDLGPLYVDFENTFRGSRADIKQRVAEYLPQLRSRNLGTPHMPVLDLGCGRGEWLEVLAENDLIGVGIDSNETCAAECRDRGLAVHIADALEYLRARPSESEGAVTAVHLVEHLPFGAILKLFDEALRVLKPGGVLILETPNPANLLVGAHTFYLDPSHVRPLPAELLRFMVESRGFCNVEVIPLHPFEDCYRLDDKTNPAAALLNDLVYGARDYSIIAERP